MNEKLIEEIKEALQKANTDVNNSPTHYIIGKRDGIKLIINLISEYYDI